MKKNIGKELKNTKGITLVALVVTIIVLLILAGVSLSAVFSQDGIFRRAEQATDKHGQAKARETLELALGEAQMQKYEEGLTDEQLTNKINEIGEEVEEREVPDISQAIVDGYIFSVDRTVPKILDYLGPADGIIITAVITQNGNWQSPVATLSGKIKTYSGGNIISSTATVVRGNANVTAFPTTGGDYTIGNITEDTSIKINATDSTGKTAEKTINVRPKRDTTGPTIKTFEVTTEGLTIIIKVIAEDTESGMQNITYNITSTQDTSLAGIPEDKRTGTLEQGKALKIETTPTGNREETTYKVTVTAKDNVGNKSEVEARATTIDGITLAEAKKRVNSSNLKDYIGTKIIDYNPEAKGTWRIFYVEDQSNYFGDGEGTLYLKRDYDTTMQLSNYTGHKTTNGGALMRQMNPMWRDCENGEAIDITNEKCVSFLCDPAQWTSYKTTDAKYAMGAPSIEMFIKAYNIYKGESILKCGIISLNGYGYASGNYGLGNSSGDIDKGKGNVFCTNATRQWLASPESMYEDSITNVSNNGMHDASSRNEFGFCPIVSIKN